MASPGSCNTVTCEVGLRSILCSVESNVVLRTACCSAGIVLPVYFTFKALERNDQDEQKKWLIYWAAYGSLRLVEVWGDKLLSGFPMYYRVKFAFLVWLQLPSVDGAKKLYENHLRPFFLRHQGWVDPFMRFAYGKMRENETVDERVRTSTAFRIRSSFRALQEVGLRLLLSPACSSSSMKMACCPAGIVLPVYSTFKAMERQDQNEQKKWLTYWAAYGSCSLLEIVADKLLSRFPMYYHVKFAFLLWLQLPSVGGAKQLYENCLRPFLSRHQAWVDMIIGSTYIEMRVNETVHSSSEDERIHTSFIARTRSSIRSPEERANETVRFTRADERICISIAARTSSSITALEEANFDGSNDLVDCVICHEQLLVGDDKTGMPCSHVFHSTCIRKWLERSRSCPLCRFNFSNNFDY